MTQADAIRSDRTVLRGDAVQVAGQVQVGSPASNCQPEIKLIKEGDIVQAIDIYCTCGQHLRVRCVYE